MLEKANARRAAIRAEVLDGTWTGCTQETATRLGVKVETLERDLKRAKLWPWCEYLHQGMSATQIRAQMDWLCTHRHPSSTHLVDPPDMERAIEVWEQRRAEESLDRALLDRLGDTGGYAVEAGL